MGRAEKRLPTPFLIPTTPFLIPKLSGGDSYRLRVGDYRILYDIDDSTRKVIAFRIKHRREAYR